MTGFTITPRYVDKQGTIPMPNARNVLGQDRQYIGHVVMHDGAWTPLYRSEDFANPDVMETLQAAAAEMNRTTAAR